MTAGKYEPKELVESSLEGLKHIPIFRIWHIQSFCALTGRSPVELSVDEERAFFE